MKHLILLRHGKTEAYHAEGDFERVLTDRGVKDARRMGRLIKQQLPEVELVVSSPAARAAQTARLAAEAIGYAGEIDWRPEIYDAAVPTLMGVIGSLPEKAKTVILVGHNPGLEDLAQELTGRDLPDGHLPTAGAAHITFDVDWAKIERGDAKLAGAYAPKTIA